MGAGWTEKDWQEGAGKWGRSEVGRCQQWSDSNVSLSAPARRSASVCSGQEQSQTIKPYVTATKNTKPLIL